MPPPKKKPLTGASGETYSNIAEGNKYNWGLLDPTVGNNRQVIDESAQRRVQSNPDSNFEVEQYRAARDLYPSGGRTTDTANRKRGLKNVRVGGR